MPQMVHCSRCYHPPTSGQSPTVGEVYNRLLVCRGEGSSPTYASHPGGWADTPTSPAHGDPGHLSPDMCSESVQVKLELGHKAVLRKKPTTEGFTHDWTVYVKGPEGSSIQHFVDKCVFHLHDSFPKPKRTIKEPPYQVTENGYGGFTLPIEIYFKNKEEPRKIRFEYDLFLHLENCPPVNHIRCEKLTFQNPTEEFRKKLLKAGGVGLPGPNASMPTPAREAQPNGSAVSTTATPENKTFTDLFGAPFKADTTTAKKHKSHAKEKVSGKPMAQSGMMGTGNTTPNPTNHTAREHKTTPSSKEKAALKRPIESPPPSKGSKKKKKDKDRDRDRERKEGEKSKHKKHKKKDKRDGGEAPRHGADGESRPVHGLKSPVKPAPAPAAVSTSTSATSSSATALRAPEMKAKAPYTQLRPFEEEVLSTGELSDSNLFDDDADDATPADQVSTASSRSFGSLKHGSGSAGGGGNKPLNALMNMISEDSLSEDDDILSPPVRLTPPPLFQQQIHDHAAAVVVNPNANSQIPVLEKEKNDKTPPPQKHHSSSKKEKSASRRSKHDKSKSRGGGGEAAPAGVSRGERDALTLRDLRREHELSEKENKGDNEDNDDNDSGVEPGHPNMEMPSLRPPVEEKAPNGEYLTALLQLQRNLMTLTDRKTLQHVVQIIEGTGLFKISDATFDFDLCCLDAKTVKRLNDLISNGMCS